MLTSFAFRISLLGFLLWFVSLTPSAVAADKVRISTGDWPPLMSESMEHFGFLSRVVKEAFAMEGISAIISFFPSKRAYEIALEGEYDASFAWVKNQERARHFLFSDPIGFNRGAFFHLRNSSFHWEVGDDLKKYDIGGTFGYSYGPIVDAMVAEGKLKLQETASDYLNFSKLVAGRIDAFPCNVAIGYHLLRTRFGEAIANRVTHHPKFYSDEQPLHLIISRKSPNAKGILATFNRGLRRLKESGRYERFEVEAGIDAHIP